MYTCINETSNHQWSLDHRLDSHGNFHSDACTPQCQAEAGPEHGTLLIGQRCSGRRCNNSTMSGGACTHDALLKDNHSTMSGGGRLSIDNRLESPKHRVSLGVHMNYYIHRKQYAQSQWNTTCHMRRKQCTLKQFETMALARQSK